MRNTGIILVFNLLLCSGFFFNKTVFAAKNITDLDEYGSDDEIKVIVSEAFTDSPENHIPKEEIREYGSVFRLCSYETEDVTLEAREESAGEDVVYEKLSPDETIPEEIETEAEDDASGEKLKTRIPLKEKSYSNERWLPDFVFTVTAEGYGADIYDLGGKEITIHGEQELMQYTNELLGLINADPGYYRINEIKWETDEYEADGKLCRDLTAKGERFVYDCSARYEGTVCFPKVQARTVRAVYKKTGNVPAGENDEGAKDETETFEETEIMKKEQETGEKNFFTGTVSPETENIRKTGVQEKELIIRKKESEEKPESTVRKNIKENGMPEKNRTPGAALFAALSVIALMCLITEILYFVLRKVTVKNRPRSRLRMFFESL